MRVLARWRAETSAESATTTNTTSCVFVGGRPTPFDPVRHLLLGFVPSGLVQLDGLHQVEESHDRLPVVAAEALVPVLRARARARIARTSARTVAGPSARPPARPRSRRTLLV